MQLNHKLLAVLTANVMMAICFSANAMIEWTLYGFYPLILADILMASLNVWAAIFITFCQLRLYAEYVAGGNK